MLKFFIRFSSLRPVVIPHHMGRKRMHLELKDTMTRVGGDIKAKVEMSNMLNKTLLMDD